MENNDVSSTNNLTVDTRVYHLRGHQCELGKKRGPNIDPCGTPAFIGSHSDV